MDEKLAAVDENLRAAEAHRFVSEIEVGQTKLQIDMNIHYHKNDAWTNCRYDRNES